MAAQVLLAAGVPVDLYDAMPSVGRKFLLAGRGGLNLTHAEPLEGFVGRSRGRSPWLAPLLRDFGPAQVREWAAGLGVETFVGTSQRVFPVDLKAAPLLRAWLHRLRAQGLRLHARHRWLGVEADGLLRLQGPAGEVAVRPRGTVLALGGGSWARLGSDGLWQPALARNQCRAPASAPSTSCTTAAAAPPCVAAAACACSIASASRARSFNVTRSSTRNSSRGDGVGHLASSVADLAVPETGDGVDVAPPGPVPEERAFAADDLDERIRRRLGEGVEEASRHGESLLPCTGRVTLVP
jgi:hypothetical protein